MRAGGFDFGLLNMASKALLSVHVKLRSPSLINSLISVCEYLLSTGDRALLAYDMTRYSSPGLLRWDRI